MNAYAVSLSKYVNTGILALFTLLAYLGLPMHQGRLRRAVEIIQRLLLVAFLVNANMTIAWLAKGAAARTLFLLCAMEILFMISFMVLYRIVHEMADMMFFNNICMLLSIGFVIISRIAYYGSMNSLEYRPGEPIKQFVMASFGMMFMLAIPFFRRFFDAMRYLGFIFGAVGIAALAGVLLLSAATNGAQITYTIAGFTFQPSEFVKILYIMMLAGMMSGEVSAPKTGFVTILAIAHVGILVLSRDLGSALIFFTVYLMMMFLATGKWKIITGGAALGIIGALAGYLLFDHVRVRVQIWQDPFSVIDGSGFQIAHSLFAISYGGLWGAGLTQGAPTKIPFVESDFIFAAITEEMGMIFAVVLLFLCINTFLRILILSAGYSNRFFQLFTYGAAVCYIFQTFLTVGGETKFIPLTGVTLPLVSYGGSSVLSTLIMFGLIEMIFILHDERTAWFKERYDQEHFGAGADGYAGVPGSGIYGGGSDNYAGAPGSTVELPENFPVNGVSEEGIFDSGDYPSGGISPGSGAFYQGQDLDGRR